MFIQIDVVKNTLYIRGLKANFPQNGRKVFIRFQGCNTLILTDQVKEF